MTGATLRPNRFDRHPLLTGITIALVLVITCDLILGSYSYRRTRRQLGTGLANERSYRRRDTIYHHGLSPLKSMDSALWGSVFYRVRTNSLGFKDAAPRVITSSSDKPRVVIIGDSFAEGVGVEFDSTAAGRLYALARPAGVDVLNAAVASYSPVIYFRKMKDLLDRLALRVDEVVVFIDLSDIMDEKYFYLDENGNVQGHPPGGIEGHLKPPDDGTSTDTFNLRVRRLLSTHSFALYRALSVAAHPIRSINALRSGQNDAEYPGPSCAPPIVEADLRCRVGWTSNDPAIMAKFGSAGLANAKKHMSDLAALLKKRGIPMTVVVYPWPHQLAWNERQSLQSTTWRDWAHDQNVGFIDLSPTFFAQVDSTSLGAVIRRDFLAGDVHWSSEGHGVVERQFVLSYCDLHADSASVRPPLATAICGARP
jgi:hypothetical protein